METVKRIAYAYEVEFNKKPEGDKKKSTKVWNAEIFVDLINEVFGKEKVERALRGEENEWVMVLDELIHDDKYIMGKFKSTRYGYKTPLLHGINLTERENPREREEGEQQNTHFLIRKVDGFLLVETGYQHIVTRGKIEDYLSVHGENVLNTNNLLSVNVGTLLSEDFFEEISKLTRVREAHIEIRTKEASGMSTPFQELMGEADKLKGNAVRLIVKAVRDKTGLIGVGQWAREIKDLNGVRAVSIVGNIEEVEKTININRNIEKYLYSKVEVDVDKVINSSDLYGKMIETATKRPLLR